jgi:hypothetical protein
VYARVSTFHGPMDQIEEGARIYQEEVIPWLREATGFRGWLVLVDRSKERGIGITFWATEQAALESEVGTGPLREEVADAVGALVDTLDLYEVSVVEDVSLDEAR